MVKTSTAPCTSSSVAKTVSAMRQLMRLRQTWGDEAGELECMKAQRPRLAPSAAAGALASGVSILIGNSLSKQIPSNSRKEAVFPGHPPQQLSKLPSFGLYSQF